MSAGGKREGAGRRKGSPNKTTAQRIAEVTASGLTPLDHMLQVLRDPLQPAERRDWAAEKAAPYCHAKLAQKDVNVTRTTLEELVMESYRPRGEAQNAGTDEKLH